MKSISIAAKKRRLHYVLPGISSSQTQEQNIMIFMKTKSWSLAFWKNTIR